MPRSERVIAIALLIRCSVGVPPCGEQDRDLGTFLRPQRRLTRIFNLMFDIPTFQRP